MNYHEELYMYDKL